MVRSVGLPVQSCFLLVVTLLATATGDPTQDFYRAGQERPILIYECYRTGVSIESKGTINVTVLWDGTQPRNENGHAIFWWAQNGTTDSYSKHNVEFSYDGTNSSLVLRGHGVKEHAIQVVQPLNGLAYYIRISLTSQENKMVCKLYDVDSRCGNAAALLRNIDQKGQLGFDFVRDVPEPTRVCFKKSLCAH